MTQEKLKEILEKHQKLLDGEKCGERADFRKADLKGVDLRGADLRYADFWGANLKGADLSGADLRYADLRVADLRDADLRDANLGKADLGSADLRYADFRGANLSGVEFLHADLRDVNLSGTKELLSAVNFMEAYFERTDEGYVAYKIFNRGIYKAPEYWEIKEGSIIAESVSFDKCCTFGSGISVAPLEWFKSRHISDDIWKVLIRWEWLCGVCVPYNSDGKIRCEKVELIEIVK